MIRVAINGFGRIGRNFLRCLLTRENSQLELVAINDTSDPKTNAHLLKYDTMLGTLNADISADEDTITVNLTAIGKSQDLWVEDIIDNTVVVGGENINCFYTVFAERKDVDKLEVEF